MRILVCLVLLCGTALSQSSDTINIKDVKTLTFFAGKLAVRRRTGPTQQLVCKDGCNREQLTSIQCENKGWDGLKVNWECRGNLRKGLRLQNTRVRCEAVPEGDTQNILVGSCMLEYSIAGGRDGGNNNYPTPRHDSSGSKGVLSYIVPIIMIVIVVIILCSVVKSCNSSNDSGGVVTVNQPPAYGNVGYPAQPGYAQPGGYPAQPGFNPGYGAAPMAAPMMAPQSRGSGLGAGIGGFAAGAATGGLLGYMLGNNGSNDHHHHYNGGGGGYDGGQNGGDFNAGDMGGGGGYEMATDFADMGMD